MKLFFLILLPFQLFANILDASMDEINPSSEEVLENKPEKFLREQSMIYDFNENLGIKDHRHFTGTDKNRFSISGHIFGGYEHVSDLLGGEILYLRRSSDYDRIWYGAQVFRHNSVFRALTQNQQKGNGSNSEAIFQRPGDAKNSLLGLGVGASYRFKLLLDFFETKDVFETIDVFLNGIQLDEQFLNRKYLGYGLSTNYGLHKRVGSSFYYGGKLSYNIAIATRRPIEDENKDDRTLFLAWPSFAFELGLFY